MSCRNQRFSSLGTKILSLCSIALFGFAATACVQSSGGSDCDDGEIKRTYKGETKCYTECDGASDCASNKKCINATICVDQGGGTGGDAMSGDDGGGTADAGTDTNGGGGGDTSVCTSSGQNKCSEIQTCIFKCPTDNESAFNKCRDNCTSNGTCQAQKRFESIQNCGESNSCDKDSAGPTCLENKCEKELRSCGVVGSATCDERQKCTTKCIVKARNETGDNASNAEVQKAFGNCLANCEFSSLDAQKKRSKLNACTESKCGDMSAPGCAFKKCESQYKSCNLFGKKSCRSMSICLNLCGDTEYQCIADCFYSGSKKGHVNRAELNACLQDNCENAQNPLQCQYKNCSQKLKDCGQLGGVNSCSSASDCSGSTYTCPSGKCVNATCQDTMDCWYNALRNRKSRKAFECLYDSTEKAQKKWSMFRSCVSDNCDIRKALQRGFTGTCEQNNCNGVTVDGTTYDLQKECKPSQSGP